MWSFRLPAEEAEQTTADAEYLGLDRTETVRRALRLLHREVEAQRAAQEISDFYGGDEAPLPDGLRR